MRRKSQRSLAALSVVATLGCSSPTLAPFAADCAQGGATCRVTSPGSVSSQRGGAGAASSTAEQPEAGSASGATLTGDVFATDSAFTINVRRPMNAIIEADGANGSVVTTSSPSGWYTLSGVLSTSRNSLITRPISTAGALGSLQVVDTTRDASVNGLVPPASAFDAIFATFSPAPLRDPRAAQVLLFFTSVANAQPIDGLSLTVPEANTVAYASGSSWTNAPDTTTDPSGRVMLVNVAARSAPTEIAVTVNGTAQQTLNVRVASGLVTFAHIVL